VGIRGIGARGLGGGELSTWESRGWADTPSCETDAEAGPRPTAACMQTTVPTGWPSQAVVGRAGSTQEEANNIPVCQISAPIECTSYMSWRWSTPGRSCIHRPVQPPHRSTSLSRLLLGHGAVVTGLTFDGIHTARVSACLICHPHPHPTSGGPA
jgi:hypothetical protein